MDRRPDDFLGRSLKNSSLTRDAAPFVKPLDRMQRTCLLASPTNYYTGCVYYYVNNIPLSKFFRIAQVR